MMALSEHAEDNKKTLHRASTNLSSAVNLLNYLIKLTCNLDDEEFDILQSILSPNVADNGDQVHYLSFLYNLHQCILLSTFTSLSFAFEEMKAS